MVKVVEKNKNGELVLPKEAFEPNDPNSRYAVQSTDGIITVTPVREEVPPSDEEVEEWIRRFDEWMASIEPRGPHIPDEALRRENLYD